MPGVFVASDRFVQAAEVQGGALGLHPHGVYVSHPIQDRTDGEMRALADGAFSEILRACTV